MIRPPQLSEKSMNIESDEDPDVPDETTFQMQRKSTATDIGLTELRYVKDLGFGSQGKVELHQYKPTGELFAVKVIPIDMDMQGRRLLMKEVKNIYNCDSPYIVGVHGFFFQDGCAKIVLEYLENGTLRNLLRRKKKIPERILAEWTRQMLCGIEYLHSLGVIHRDIKPSNFLFDNIGNIRISDFGISAEVLAGESARDTWVGSVAYMSPERIRGEKYKFDSDIWSLGITIYEAATGHQPIHTSNTGNSIWEILMFLEENEMPSLSSDDFSPEMNSFVLACLEKDPLKRTTIKKLKEHPWVVKTEKPQQSEIIAFLTN